MKRLVTFVIILILPVIAFFEWAAYKRAHFPADFIYATSDSIDLTYHRPELVADYYESAVDLERFSRHCWKEYKLDVRADKPLEGPEKDLILAYKQQLIHLRKTEDLLKRSYVLKQGGADAETVKDILESGLSAKSLKVKSILGGKETLAFEDQGEAVFQVQKLLEAKGYDLPVDGYFERRTMQAVKDFQKSVGLFPNGKVSDITLAKLLD